MQVAFTSPNTDESFPVKEDWGFYSTAVKDKRKAKLKHDLCRHLQGG